MILRLVIALAIGASTQQAQAFVVAPQHRLALTSYPRKYNCLSDRSLRVSDNGGRPTRRGHVPSPRSRNNPNNDKHGAAGVAMRVRGPGRKGGNVEIEGVRGERRRVQRRRPRRRPGLRDIRQVAAAAVVVQQEQGVDETMMTAEDREAAALEERQRSLADAFEASERFRDGREFQEDQIGTVQDKYTKIYVPMDGIVIKKTYGFWTWQVFGAIFVQHFVRSIIRKGGNLKKTSMQELNWDHIVTEPEHLLELKAYCCEECGYTLFPARGRHEQFFDNVEDFKCPECDAPRSAFFDANDKDDPHNQKKNEDADEGEEGEGTGGTGGDTDGDESAGGNAEASATAGGPPTAARKKAPAVPSPSPSAPSASAPSAAPDQRKSPPESPGKEERGTAEEGDNDDEDEDDLLDF